MIRIIVILLNVSAVVLAQQSFQVPGISDLFLAGQPAGTTYGSDSVPLNSPTQANISLAPGQALIFSATGQVGTPDNNVLIPPTGSNTLTRIFGGPSGFGGIIAPGSALIGMFLCDRISTSAELPLLDFSAGAQDVPMIAPLLQQPFYIGDGRTPSGGPRKVVIPAGATRLFLAVNLSGNANGNSRNTGRFSVTVTTVTPPAQPSNPLAVPAISELFLAAQPAGTTYGSASAPLNSPPEVITPIVPGQVLRIVASGRITMTGNSVSIPPSGVSDRILSLFGGPFGFGGLKAFPGSLIGVFVGGRLDLNLQLPVLDFTGGALDLAMLSPLLQQPFYIGDGKTPSGVLRRFTVPAGATRLFLGVNGAPGSTNNNGNSGAFLVTVSPDLPNTPVISPGGVTNAAGFGRPPIAAGSIAAMFGTNFSPVIAGASATPLPTRLAGTTIWTDLIAAPAFFTSPTQSNFQVPFEIPSQRIQVVVNANGIASLPELIDLTPAVPGIFVSGTGAPVIVSSQTGSLVSATNPAKVGDTLVIYATGLPAPTPPPTTGGITPTDHLYRTSATVTVKLGTLSITPIFSGLTPGLIGVYQVNVTIPSNSPTGVQSLQILAGASASNSVQIGIN